MGEGAGEGEDGGNPGVGSSPLCTPTPTLPRPGGGEKTALGAAIYLSLAPMSMRGEDLWVRISSTGSGV
jgi:hypothetical protein